LRAGSVDPEALAQKNEERQIKYTARIPLRRFGEYQELAAVAVFLASDASSYVNGVSLLVDGGLTGNAGAA
jgi:glucose 1-dehydrogenase/3-oxoacyl-[acyl-carrier protein] reductase